MFPKQLFKIEIMYRLFWMGFFFLFQFYAKGYCNTCITGKLPQEKGKKIYLEVYQHFGKKLYDSTLIDATGYFQLKYLSNVEGAGNIYTNKTNVYPILLSDRELILKGGTLANYNSIFIEKGESNIRYHKYLIHKNIFNSFSFVFLNTQNLLASDSNKQYLKNLSIFIQQQQKQFLKSSVFSVDTVKSTYVSWYIQQEENFKTINEIVSLYPNADISTYINHFRNYNFKDKRFENAGLIDRIFETHFFLLQNHYSQKQEDFVKQIQLTIDALLEATENQDIYFNGIANTLFNYFLKNSYNQFADLVATKITQQKKLSIYPTLEKKIQFFTKIKIGKTVPNIVFDSLFLVKKTDEPVQSLYGLQRKYKIIIFGASWCDACSQELSNTIQWYDSWKQKGAECMFIALDTEQVAFKQFVRQLPYIAYCDYRGWESIPAKEYAINASPTILVLDKDNKLIDNPKSVQDIIYYLN